MISTEAIATWLRQQGAFPAEAAIVTDGNLPSMPDFVVVLTATGGPGTLRERTFDAATLQVITRGPQRDPATAEWLADLVDGLFMALVPPVAIGSMWIVSIDYSGGPPAFMADDEARRRLFVTSYLMQVARSVN